MKALTSFILLIMWIYGFVLAKGFWSTLFCIIPFWAWYLSVENFAYRLLGSCVV